MHVVLGGTKRRRAPDLRNGRDSHRKMGCDGVDLAKARLVDNDPLRPGKRIDPAEGDDGVASLIHADVEASVGDLPVSEVPPGSTAPGRLNGASLRISVTALVSESGLGKVIVRPLTPMRSTTTCSWRSRGSRAQVDTRRRTCLVVVTRTLVITRFLS